MTTDPHPAARQFELEIEIAAPRDAVWRAISEAEGITRWFAAEAEVEPGADGRMVGGRMVWDWEGHYHWPLTITVWEPGARLGTRYDSTVDDGEGGKVPLFVDFHLSGAGGRTTLRLVHSGFGAEASFDDEFDGISGGWPIELESLRLSLERHAGEERHLAWSRARTSLAPEEAWGRVAAAVGIPAPPPRAGERFELALPGGERVAGTATGKPGARGLSGVAESAGHGYFHGHAFVDPERGDTIVWLWLALYGDAAGERERYLTAFDRALAEALPAAERQAAGSARG